MNSELFKTLLVGMEMIEAIDMRASLVQVAPCSKSLGHRLSNS